MNMAENTKMETFTNGEFGCVRVVLKDGEPWFVAADVCKCLEIANSRDAISRLDEDEKMTVGLTDSHSGQRGGAQMMTIVSEAGLYSLVLGSRKPEAKAFKRWITHDVIPTIRRFGVYMTDNLLDKVMETPDFLFIVMDTLYKYRAENADLVSRIAD